MWGFADKDLSTLSLVMEMLLDFFSVAISPRGFDFRGLCNLDLSMPENVELFKIWMEIKWVFSKSKCA